MPSSEEVKLLEREAEKLGHDTPLDDSPVARRWVQRVLKWFKDLVAELGIDKLDVHLRFRACIQQWKIICSYLPNDQAQRILRIIREGYRIHSVSYTHLTLPTKA